MKKAKSDAGMFLRQLDIFNPANFEDTEVHIVGAGGIGSFTAVALAKLGLERIIIWDGDKIEKHNLPNQFHALDQLGKNKAIALSDTVNKLTGAFLQYAPKFWSPKDPPPLRGIVISAVDHMEKTKDNKNAGRRELWKAVKDNPNVDLFVDGRIGGQALRVLAISPMADRLLHGWFERRMFPQSAAKELPCTSRNIIDVGFQISALITNVVRKFLVNGGLENNERDIIMDMASLTITKGMPE